MIYGAYGYTGKLIAQEAKRQGLSPVLAGRNPEKAKSLANELDMPWKAFSLEDETGILQAFKDVKILVNCAGPFSQTFAPMAAACLKAGVHYFDITGEIDIFEQAQKLNEKAKERGIILCPGVGFDVVPTDCLAMKLKSLLPDANFLALGFDGLNTSSAGTAKTMVEGLDQGAKIREDGKVVSIPFGSKTREIDFGKGKKLAMAIPWGDVSSAFFSTGIQNIQVYTPVKKERLKFLKIAETLKQILSSRLVKSLLKKAIGKQVSGPDEDKRRQERSFVWGEALNSKGEKKTLRIETANGYELSATASVEIVKKLLKGESSNSGYHTPGTLMGHDFVTELSGSGQWREF